jgi:hypothetical protein
MVLNSGNYKVNLGEGKVGMLRASFAQEVRALFPEAELAKVPVAW